MRARGKLSLYGNGSFEESERCEIKLDQTFVDFLGNSLSVSALGI